jgi:hypothetical protein
MEHEPLRTDVLLAALTATIRAGNASSEQVVSYVYDVVDRVMVEETKRVYKSDLLMLTSLLGSLRKSYDSEQMDDFRHAVSAWAQGLLNEQGPKPKNPHVVRLLLRAAKLIQMEKEMTPAALAQQILSHCENAVAETARAQAAL